MPRISIRPLLERFGLIDENAEKLERLQAEERLHGDRPPRRSWFTRSQDDDDPAEALRAENERLTREAEEREAAETARREADFDRRAEEFGFSMVQGSFILPYERENLTKLYRQILIDDHADGTSTRVNLLSQAIGGRRPHNLTQDLVVSNPAAKTWFQNHPA